jgi:ABC-type multidrug transport system fused ATPase/permease subunit
MVPEKEQPAAREDVISLERGNFFWNSIQLKDSLLGKTRGPTPGDMSIIGVYNSKKIRQLTGDTSPGSRRKTPTGRCITFSPVISGGKGYGQTMHPKDEHSAPLLRVLSSQDALLKLKGSDATGRNRKDEAFRFPEGTLHNERFFLSNIDLKISKNSFTVIVGLKNSGKTSLLYALLGEMSMDNYHTHEVSRTNRLDCDCCEIKCHCASLHGPKLRILNDMCLVTRQPYVLPFSILKNIILDQPLDIDKLKWALKVSQLEDDLILFPEGLETIITPQNKKLTKGQKLRLSLARNLYKDCEIYCFDSFLEKNFDENASKSFLEKTLLQDLGDKTRILITSDCRHAKYADKVLVMKAGKISAFDTYEKI